jgi:hypothetical protein
MNTCCYTVCCCDGELDYCFFWACPTIYELVCVNFFPHLDQTNTPTDVGAATAARQ